MQPPIDPHVIPASSIGKLFATLRALVLIAAAFVVVLYAATFWAIGKSRDRTECYKAALAEMRAGNSKA